MAKIAKKSVVGNSLTIEFANGVTKTYDVTKIPTDVQDQLMMHGLSQKVGDSYASAETVEDAIEAAEDVFHNLVSGQWNAKGGGTGGILAEALAAAQGVSLEEAKAVVLALDDKAKTELRKHPAIKLAIAKIQLARAERLTKGGTDDLSGLFDNLPASLVEQGG